jgi:uncharacterized membrane protein YphA (DoxX/SURF4 family)
MTIPIPDSSRTQESTDIRLDLMAFALRVGLGLVFVIGGWNKLSKLLDPAREAGLVGAYTGPHGYINEFFAQFLFGGASGGWITPWGFLTALSTFELVSGILLVIGVLVRPLALVYGFLLWTFVIALPVVTAPGVEVAVTTFTSPAILVQIRDIALSGMMFTLFNLGSGAFSSDARLFGPASAQSYVGWDSLGLLLRLSIAAPLIVGGVFNGLNGIPTFATPAWILLPLGVVLAGGVIVRPLGAAVAAVMLWYIWTKISLDKSLIANLNGFKRELAFLAAGGVLAYAGGGPKFTFARAVEWVRGFAATSRGAPVE